MLPQMYGSTEVLQAAKENASSEHAKSAVARLEEIYHYLCAYGVEDYITFDFGLVSKYQYYTGIIFQAYTYGSGEPLLKGGRYNELMRHFGKPAPSVGFVIVVDSLLAALPAKKLQEDAIETITLKYRPEETLDAIRKASALRKEGKNVAMVPMR